MAKYVVGYLAVLFIGLLVAVSLFATSVVGGGWQGEFRPAPIARVDPGAINAEFPVNMIVVGAHGRSLEQPHSANWEFAGGAQGMEGMGRAGGYSVYENYEEDQLQFIFDVAWDLAIAVYDSEDCLVFDGFYPGTDSLPPIETIGPPGSYLVEMHGSHRQGDASWIIGIEQHFDDLWQAGC